MANVDQYKTILGYGVRNNLFEVVFTSLPPKVASVYPTIISPNNQLAILAHKATLPETRKTTATEIIYKGERMNYVTEREDYTHEIPFSFRNATDYLLRNLFEFWMNLNVRPFVGDANQNGIRLVPADYKVDFSINVLNHERVAIRTFDFFGCFPRIVGPDLDLDFTKGEITETDVTMSIDQYKIRSVAGTPGVTESII